ncbi:2Fe-2S iron-sulfur cluster-binding protein [Streptomyces sp. ME01-24h]|nr:2Fe-2S iron-sulfur cluster-binding protein [Streptomyces sp. ME01-24h]
MSDDVYDDRTPDGRMTDQPQGGSPQPHGGGFTPGHGVWEPSPHGEYDPDQTMHVSFAAQLSMTDPGADPLAAPGHGYAPEPPAVPMTVARAEAPAVPAAGEDAATTWAIPVVREDAAADDSGEYAMGAFATAPGPEPAQPWTAHAAPQAAPAAHTGPADGGWALPADATGQWRLPLTPDGVAEEPGEYRFPAGSAAEPGPAADPGPAHEPASGPAAAAGEPGLEPVPGEDGAYPQAPAPEPATDHVPDHVAGLAPDLAAQEPPAPPEAAGEPDDAPGPDAHSEHPVDSYVLNVNGTDRPVTDAWLGESLLYVLRERLGLAGAKDGCEQGECGACSVKVDGRLVASCLVPAATAAGSDIRTVEGLSADGGPSDVQRALAACGAVQCGFCIPGMAMTVHDLLEGNHHPTELETRQAISGNLCRCSGYQGVLEAVRQVVAERAVSAEDAADDTAADPADSVRVPHPRPSSGGPA